MPRLGIITRHWLPAFGGAERHTHDLAATLLDHGIDVRVFCETAAVEGRDNGRVPATRWCAPTLAISTATKDEQRTAVAATHAFIDEACRWAEANEITRYGRIARSASRNRESTTAIAMPKATPTAKPTSAMRNEYQAPPSTTDSTV